MNTIPKPKTSTISNFTGIINAFLLFLFGKFLHLDKFLSDYITLRHQSLVYLTPDLSLVAWSDLGIAINRSVGIVNYICKQALISFEGNLEYFTMDPDQ